MRLRELLAVGSAALLTAVVMTWPLATDMFGRLPYDPRFERFSGSDMNIWVWNFWWARQVVERGVPPFYCDVVFPPFGHSLAFHTHTFAWGLVSVPLQWIGGIFFAVNAMVLLLLAAAATAAYVLAREVRLDPASSAIAGFAWGFSPYFLQKGLVHFNLFASPWMPLALVCLLRWTIPREKGSGRKRDGTWRSALGLGAVAGLSLLTGSLQSVYLAVAVLVVTSVAPGRMVDPGERPCRRRLLSPLPVVVCLAVLWLTAQPFLVEWWSEWHALEGGGAFAQAYHPRLADFFTPSGLHPVFRGLGAGAALPDAPFPTWRPEHSALYLRFSLLALAALGALRVKAARRWCLVFAVLFLLAWDPGPEPEGFLAQLYRRVPPFDLLRVPARFLPAALLPLTLAAGAGFRALRASRRGRWAALVLAAGLLFESWSAPYPSIAVHVPAAVQELSLAPRGEVVLKLPYEPGASISMLWQTQHELPAAISYIARTNPDKEELLRTTAPDLYLLLTNQRPSTDGLALDLRFLDIHHILVLEEGMADPGELYDLLDELEGWERAHDAGDGVTRWYKTHS